jgi:heme/copper-type cytochrome/quinol oxidase subunit 1
VIVMGATWECLSFCLKTVGSRDQQQMGWAIGSTLLFLLAPLWINAFVYMVVARLVHYVLPDQRLWGCKATWLTRMFVTLDVVSFVVQAAGGSMMSQEDTEGDIVRKGQQVYMVGIGIQGAFVVVFGAMTVGFYLKMVRGARDGRDTKRTRILVWIMFAVLTLIMVSFPPDLSTGHQSV